MSFTSAKRRRPSAGARRPSAGPRPLPLSPSKAPVSNFRRPPPGKGLRRSATDPKSASFSGRSPTEERSPTPARRGPPPGKGLRRSSTDPRSASRAAYPPKSRAAYPSKKAPYPSATDRLFSKSESSLPVQKSATSRLFNHSASEGNMPPPRPSLVRSGSTRKLCLTPHVPTDICILSTYTHCRYAHPSLTTTAFTLSDA